MTVNSKQKHIVKFMVYLYEGESTENLKSMIKIRNTVQLSCFDNDTQGLKSGQQVAVQHYIEK